VIYVGTSVKVELVKNMGIMIKSTCLAAALRQSKRQPKRLLCYQMVELFSQDKLCCSTVQGKKGSLPGLVRDTMDAILYKLLLFCIIFHILISYRLYNA